MAIKLNKPFYLSREYLFHNAFGRSIMYSWLVLLFVLGGVFLILLPQTKSLVSRWNKIGKMEKENDKMGGDIAILSSWNWPETEKTAKLAEFAFPARKDIYLIVFAVKDPVARNGFVIDSMSFDLGKITGENVAGGKKKAVGQRDKKGLSGPETINVNLSILGRQENLAKVIDDFNNSLPLISVSDISFSSQGENATLVKAKMKLKIYFYPDEKKKVKIKRNFLQNLQLSRVELATVAKLKNYYDRGSDFYQRLKIRQKSSGSSRRPGDNRSNPFALP